MTVYGVTSAGFVKKRIADIQTEIQTSLRASLGPTLNLLSSSVLGQIVGIIAEREALLWELAEATYASQYPDTASGVSLDNAVALTGVKRLAATSSTVTVTATGTVGTVISTSVIFAVSGTAAAFQPIQAVTIPVGGSIAVPCRSTVTGPVQALAGTLTVIQTPVSGLTSVTNAADAVLGTNVETDAALQLRRLQSLQIAGSSTVEAIRSKLLNLTGVTSAKVIENPFNATDSSGRPPHSYECLVLGGADADIRTLLWNSKPSGIQTYGNVAGTITDSQGFSQPINFSRPVLVPIYLVVTLHTNSNYPADGDTQVVNALISYGQSLGVNQPVYNWMMLSALDDIPGIETLVINQDIVPSPTGTANIAIGVTQVAQFTSSNISLVHV